MLCLSPVWHIMVPFNRHLRKIELRTSIEPLLHPWASTIEECLRVEVSEKYVTQCGLHILYGHGHASNMNVQLLATLDLLRKHRVTEIDSSSFNFKEESYLLAHTFLTLLPSGISHPLHPSRSSCNSNPSSISSTLQLPSLVSLFLSLSSPSSATHHGRSL